MPFLVNEEKRESLLPCRAKPSRCASIFAGLVITKTGLVARVLAWKLFEPHHEPTKHRAHRRGQPGLGRAGLLRRRCAARRAPSAYRPAGHRGTAAAELQRGKRLRAHAPGPDDGAA